MAHDPEAFGEWLRSRRRERELGQKDLAEAAGVTFYLVSKVERGHVPAPSTEVLLAWADRMALDRDEVLARAGKPPPDLVARLLDLDFVRWLREQIRGYDAPTGSAG
jgi:transcriptional regulator with XRE-family HTH domain